jgi:hypothetical protein
MTKWLISGRKPLSAAVRRAYWESVHKDDRYRTVCSLTDSTAVLDRLSSALSGLSPSLDILIPGCGSRTSLQRRLIADRPSARLTCVDYPAVVAIASADFPHPNVTYLAHDLAAPCWTESFDAVLCVNAVVSESDEENRLILRNCREAMRTDALFVGYFPTLFAPFEIALLSGDESRIEAMDLPSSTFYEAGQDAHQIFYTPLRLRVILREAGFVLQTLEIAFLDSPEHFGRDTPWRNPGADDVDLVIYELLALARKS